MFVNLMCDLIRRKVILFDIDMYIWSKSFVDFCSMNIMFVTWSAPLMVNGNPYTNLEV